MKKSIKSSVQRAIALSVISASVITIAATSEITLSTAEKNSKIQAESLAASYAFAISESIDSIKDEIKNIAQNENIANPSIPLEDRKSYLKLARRNTVFTDLSVSDKNGNTYSGVNISDQGYFQEAMGGKTFISSPLSKKEDNSAAIIAASQLTSLGPTGIVYGTIKLDFFNKYTEQIKLGETGYGFIIDKNGNFVANPDANLLSSFANAINNAENKSETGLKLLLSKIVSEKSRKSSITTMNGQKVLLAFAPIESEEGWTLVVSQNYSEIISECYKNILISIAVLAFIILCSIPFSRIISKSISAPINKAVDRLSLLAQGDLHSPIPQGNFESETKILLDALETTSNSMQSYIYDISNVLKNISDGNLAVISSQEYQGDFEPIKISLEKIINSLNLMINEIKSAAYTVSKNAAQVSEGAITISNNSSVEASAIEELDSMMDEISKSVMINTQNVQKAKILAEKIEALIQEEKQNMQNVLKSIEEMNINSQQISKIIHTIDDIAFQTNILALNASVEAARVGSAGKGFAVVASEVRNLAQRSADAVNDTESLIGITIDSIKSSTNYADTTFKNFEEIMTSSEEIFDLIENIFIASNNQTESIKQMQIGMEQITNSIIANSSFANQSLAASKSLSEQAKGLEEKLSKFKLKSEGIFPDKQINEEVTPFDENTETEACNF